MKKTVLVLSAAAVCVASAAPVLAEGQNPMTAPVQISMQGEASMTVANDEAVILFSAESRRPDAVSASNDAAKRGNAAIEALKRFSEKIDVGTTGLSTGITPDLSAASKVLLSLTMYTGRLGALTLATVWMSREVPACRYSEEDMMIG